MIKETERSVEFEIVPCAVCNGEHYREQLSFSDAHGHYAIAACSQCGFQFLNPRPTESTIGIYYSAAHYMPFFSSEDRADLFHRAYAVVRKFSVRWKRKRIENHKSKGSVLDLGSGTGEFLHEMKAHGWEAAGLEPSQEASEFARAHLDVNVHTGSLNEEGFKPFTRLYDVITMWHVLEHVHHPKPALEQIKRLLKEDGLLVIAVPNISSYDARVYGERWVALDVPRHLFHFTPSSLSLMLKDTGLEIFKKHQMPLDTVFNCLMSEKNNARNVWMFPFYLLRLTWAVLFSLVAGLHSEKGSSIVYYIRKIRQE